MAETGGGPNGAVEGHDQVLYIAQNGGRAAGAGDHERPETPESARAPDMTGGVQAIDAVGNVSWVTRDPIAPNDLCFGPDGCLYITDPTRTDASGRRTRSDGRLWRYSFERGEAGLLSSVEWYPNGIGFGFEDDALYVASTGERRIVRFPLSPSGLGEPETYIQMERTGPDGFAFATDGSLVVCGVTADGSPGDIQIWSADRQLLDVIEPGSDSRYTNVALAPGGTCYITSSNLGAVLATDDLGLEPLPLHPFR